MKTIKSITKYVSCIFLSLLVFLSLYTLIYTGLFKKSYVNVFGYTYFVIASGSMSPTIEVNDIIIVKLDSNYKEDDIITYASGDSFVTHRVLEIDGEKLITQGDANNAEDDEVESKDVIGKVVTIISSSFLLKTLGVIILLFIIISVINFDEILKKYIKKEKMTDSPLDYTRVIPIVKKDEDLIEDILNKTTLYKVSKIKIADETIEIKLAGETPCRKTCTNEDKELIKEILNILKSNSKKSKITTEGAIKLQYMYRLCNTIILDPEKTEKVIDNITFEELFNYNFEEIGFTKKISKNLYTMPIYVYLLIMVYSITYGNDEYFDAIYKSLKYRIKISADTEEFINNNYKVDKCIKYIEEIVKKCDDRDKFELEKIVRIINLEKTNK